MADQNEVPPQSANCDNARSSGVTPNQNASRSIRCPLCDCPETEPLGLVRVIGADDHRTKAILAQLQCDRCGEKFLIDDDGVVS